MASLASKLMPALLTLRGSKKILSSGEATLAHIAGLQLRPRSHTPSRRLQRAVDFSMRRFGGWPVYEVSPRTTTTLRRALYIHGGGWVAEISLYHWEFIAALAAASETSFVVPIYPLVPLGTAGTVIPIATSLAAAMITEIGSRDMVLIGDSAGGTITLAIAMQLRDRGIPPPHRTVLISPALDLGFGDPLIAQIAPHDPFLATPGLQAAAKLWRGDRAIDDPMVSPIHGDLTALGPMAVFSGTHDILNADARRFVRLAASAGLQLDYHEAPDMVHIYPLLPIPEGRRARGLIKSMLMT